MRIRRTRPRRRRGGALVELVIVINILLVLLLAVCEFSRMVLIRNLAANAAREGARQAVVKSSAGTPLTTAQIQAVVTGFLAGQTVNNLTIQVYQADPATGANVGAWSSASPGSDVAVQVDFDYQPMVPAGLGILSSNLHMSTKAMMLTEGN